MITENYKRELKIAASQHSKEKEYWLDKFSGELNKSYFPYDFHPGKRSEETGDAEADIMNPVKFKFSPQSVSRLIKLSTGSLHTLHIILTAALTALLTKYTSSRDIIIGTPIFQQYTGGKFINTVLPLRNRLKTGITFKELLLQVKQTVIEAVENQQFPMELLAGMLNHKGHPDDFSLFDTAILLENIQDKRFIRHLNPKVTLSFRRTDNRIQGAIEYPSSLYEKTTIDRLIAHYSSLMDRVLRDLNQEIANIEILSEAEKKQLLVDFNDTTAEYPRDSTIHQLFAAQVQRTPHNIALVGPLQIKNRTYMSYTTHITYRELNQKSNQLSHLLTEKGVKPDTIVGIMVKRSVEMIIGILGILKSGGAYLPIDQEYPGDRINYMLADSAAKILLTSDAINRVPTPHHLSFNLSILSSFSTLTLTSTSTCQVSPTNLAYVIYTSGSTGKPKGVMIRHRSVINRLNWMQRFYPLAKDDVILQKTPFTFDVSVWELSWWWFQGSSLCLLEPGEEKNPAAIIEAIIKNKVTTIHFVPSMLTVFLEYPEEMTATDFYTYGLSLRQVFSSGEALGTHQVKKFNTSINVSNNIKLINLYGPTEATVDVSYFNCPPGQILDRVPIGKPIDNTCLYIVNQCMGLQPIGIPGELCISGEGLARGYLNQPELTAEKFLSAPYRSYRSHISYISKRLYRTGDLARWLVDGNIEFLGRIDFQVKIRGFRVELGEIENHLLNHNGIKETVVVAKDGELCAYIVLHNELVPELRDYLEKRLPGYMIPSYFVRLKEIPLTPNGKVNSKALPEPEITSGSKYVAPRSEIEKKLIEIWAELLGRDASHASQLRTSIGIDDNFFKLGGHSLKATRLAAKQQKILHIKMPVTEIFKTPTIRKLAEYIKGAKKNVYLSIQAVEKKEYYPASSAQKRMIILNQLKGDDISDNLSTVIRIEGNLDIPHFEKVVRMLIEKHEAFRTSFTIINENHVQQVHQSIDFEIDYMESRDNKDIIEGIIREFIRPFDLTGAPLLRVGLIQLPGSKHILIFDMHHIISDAVSREILTNEFLALFRSQKMPELKIQYKDFTCWQNEFLQSDIVKKAGEYWLNVFSGEIPVPDMPIDYPRPPIQSFEGDYFDFEFSETLTKRIDRLVFQGGTTLYMVLLAIYTILLSKYSGQEDIVVGTPAAGRPHIDLENIIGFFVNTLAMRNYPQKEKTFSQFLEEVKINALKAYENQDYQFEELVEKLELPRDQSRSILFDTMFALQNAADIPQHVSPTPKNTVDETTDPVFSYYEYKEKGTQFDIITHAYETGSIIRFKLRYATKLFRRTTIEKFIEDFIKIAEKLTEDTDIQLKDIQISHGFTGTNIEIHQYDQGDFEF